MCSCWFGGPLLAGRVQRSAAAALGICSGLGGVRRTPDVFPLWAAWTWQGTFSLWAVGRGPPWRSEWGPQTQCPPESSYVVGGWWLVAPPPARHPFPGHLWDPRAARGWLGHT